MRGVDPKYSLWTGLVLAAGTIAAVAYFLANGDQESVKAVLGIAVPLLLSAFGIHNQQITSKVQQAVEQTKVSAEDAANAATLGIRQNDAIIAKVDAVKQEIRNADSPREG